MTGYPHQSDRSSIWRRIEDSAIKCECGTVKVRGLYRYGVERVGKLLAGLPPIQWDAALYCSQRCRDEWEGVTT